MSIFRFKEVKCTLDVLRILNKGKSTYTKIYKQSKVSHTILQRTLENLTNKALITRHVMGHMLVDYKITDKGVLLLENLREIKKLVD